MKEEVYRLEEKFQPYLKDMDYTFVGPEDFLLMEDFIKNVNMVAPVVAMFRTVHHALTNRKAVRFVIDNLRNDVKLRVYVVVRGKTEAPQMFIHATIDEYCRRNNIEFNA